MATSLSDHGIGIQSDGPGLRAKQTFHIDAVADGDVVESQDIAFDDRAGGQGRGGADNKIHVARLNVCAQSNWRANSGDEGCPDPEDELVRGTSRRQSKSLTGANGGTRRNVIGPRS